MIFIFSWFNIFIWTSACSFVALLMNWITNVLSWSHVFLFFLFFLPTCIFCWCMWKFLVWAVSTARAQAPSSHQRDGNYEITNSEFVNSLRRQVVNNRANIGESYQSCNTLVLQLLYRQMNCNRMTNLEWAVTSGHNCFGHLEPNEIFELFQTRKRRILLQNGWTELIIYLSNHSTYLIVSTNVVSTQQRT